MFFSNNNPIILLSLNQMSNNQFPNIMKKLNFRYLPALFAGLLFISMSCSKSNSSGSSLYTPTTADVTSTATLTELLQGRTLFINNCNSCHGLYSPDNYTATEWKSIISNMGPRTSMSSSEILLVTKYVTRGK
jgi:hypothetical protein